MSYTTDKLIEELLDRIDECYTEKRKTDIKNRMDAFWDSEYPPDRFPYTVNQIECDIKIPDEIIGFDNDLITQLAAIANHGERFNDDYYPGLFPGLRQVTLPSYFGCVEVSEFNEKVVPIVKEPTDVYNLPEPGFIPELIGGSILEKMRYWRERTKGRIAIYETDMQGPFSVASQVYDIEKFFTACYENPDEAHYLISKCTEVYIKFTKEMFKIAGDDLIPIHCMPCLYYPQSKGVALSEDLLAVVSPDFVREYINPYSQKIADEFGGVTIHTCGAMHHVIGALNEIPGLKGLNFSTSETDFAEMAKLAKDKTVFLCHNSLLSTGDLPVLHQLDHVIHMGEIMRKYKVNGYTMIFNHPSTPENQKIIAGMEKKINELLRA